MAAEARERLLRPVLVRQPQLAQVAAQPGEQKEEHDEHDAHGHQDHRHQGHLDFVGPGEVDAVVERVGHHFSGRRAIDEVAHVVDLIGSLQLRVVWQNLGVPQGKFRSVEDGTLGRWWSLSFVHGASDAESALELRRCWRLPLLRQ